MAGVITTGAHPKALWPGVHKFTHMAYNEYPTEYTTIFDVRSSDKNREETVESTGFGLAQVKPEGAAVSYDSHNQGATTTFRHLAYGLGWIVTREENDDNLYSELARSRSRALVYSFRQTKETVHANVLNRAFSSIYPGGDGKELCATDHPSLGAAQSNELAVAADLSESSLEDLITQISQAQNSRGLKIRLMPRKLIVPPALMFEAERIVNSTLRPGTANNDVNAMRSMGSLPDGVMIYHYLSDDDNWFVQTDVPDGLICFDRTAFQFTRDNDFDTENAKAKGYERYAVGWADWRSIYGSSPS